MNDMTPISWAQMDKDARLDAVRRLAHDADMSASQIAAAIPGATRNAVIGVIHRSRGQIRLRRQPDQNSSTPGRARVQRGHHPKGSPDRIIRPIKVAPKTAEEIFHAPAWKPLPDTEPVSLLNRAPDGCRWPVTVEGKTLFCNCHVPKRADKLVYCDAHMKHYRSTPQ